MLDLGTHDMLLHVREGCCLYYRTPAGAEVLLLPAARRRGPPPARRRRRLSRFSAERHGVRDLRPPGAARRLTLQRLSAPEHASGRRVDSVSLTFAVVPAATEYSFVRCQRDDPRALADLTLAAVRSRTLPRQRGRRRCSAPTRPPFATRPSAPTSATATLPAARRASASPSRPAPPSRRRSAPRSGPASPVAVGSAVTRGVTDGPRCAVANGSSGSAATRSDPGRPRPGCPARSTPARAAARTPPAHAVQRQPRRPTPPAGRRSRTAATAGLRARRRRSTARAPRARPPRMPSARRGRPRSTAVTEASAPGEVGDRRPAVTRRSRAPARPPVGGRAVDRGGEAQVDGVVALSQPPRGEQVARYAAGNR